MRNPLEATETEHSRWRQRERRLVEALREIGEERSRLEEERSRVEQQVAYYDSLTRDMKREYRRPALSDLLSSFRRS